MSAYEEDLASLRAVVRAAVLDYLTPEGPEGGSEPEVDSVRALSLRFRREFRGADRPRGGSDRVTARGGGGG